MDQPNYKVLYTILYRKCQALTGKYINHNVRCPELQPSEMTTGLYLVYPTLGLKRLKILIYGMVFFCFKNWSITESCSLFLSLASY